jgi:hypothetical protein
MTNENVIAVAGGNPEKIGSPISFFYQLLNWQLIALFP